MPRAGLLSAAAVVFLAAAGTAAPAQTCPLLTEASGETYLFDESPFGSLLAKDGFAELVLLDPTGKEDLTIVAALDEDGAFWMSAKAGTTCLEWKKPSGSAPPEHLMEAFPELEDWFLWRPVMREAATLFFNDLQFKKAWDIWSGESLGMAVHLSKVTRFLPRFPLLPKEVKANRERGLDPDHALVARMARETRDRGPETARFKRALRLANINGCPTHLEETRGGVILDFPYLAAEREKVPCLLQAPQEKCGEGRQPDGAWALWEQGGSPVETY